MPLAPRLLLPRWRHQRHRWRWHAIDVPVADDLRPAVGRVGERHEHGGAGAGVCRRGVGVASGVGGHGAVAGALVAAEPGGRGDWVVAGGGPAGAVLRHAGAVAAADGGAALPGTALPDKAVE